MIISRRQFYDKDSYIQFLNYSDEEFKKGKSTINSAMILDGLSLSDIDFDIIFELFNQTPIDRMKESGLEISTDAEYLERIFKNLFDTSTNNARKYKILTVVSPSSTLDSLQIPYVEGTTGGEKFFPFKYKSKRGKYPTDVPLYLREYETLNTKGFFKVQYTHKYSLYNVYAYIPRNYKSN